MSAPRRDDARNRGPAESDAEREPPHPELPAEHALLGLLVLSGGTAHGYDLARQFRRGMPLGEVIRLEPAMLYKHLKKLERLGWLTMSLVDQSPRPPRQVCTLTPAGEAELQRWLAEPVARTREIRLEFLVKLFFAWRLNPVLAHRLASEQREVVLQLANSLERQLAADRSAGQQLDADAANDAYRRMVLQLRREQTLAAASWLEHIAATFRAAVADTEDGRSAAPPSLRST